MRLDWLALAWLAGITLAQRQTQLLDLTTLAIFGLAACCAGWLCTRYIPASGRSSMAGALTFGQEDCRIADFQSWKACLAVAFLLTATGVLGFVWAGVMAHDRLQSQFPSELENTEHLVQFEVAGLPAQTESPRGTLVRVRVRLTHGVTQALGDGVLLSWPGACARPMELTCEQTVWPGQRWQARVRLRAPHGSLNEFGPDQQARMLQQGIRVTAQLRGSAVYLGELAYRSPQIWIAQWRQYILSRLHQAMPNGALTGVLVALAIGDQQGISEHQWEWFSRAGMSHLVAISGTHVSLMASLAGLLGCSLVRRICWRKRERTQGWVQCPEPGVPMRIVFVLAGTLAALIYCLLAGWGIPAQRTFYTLACAGAAITGRVRLPSRDCLAMALIVLTAIDPWSVLTTGLWLSFAAVVTLLVFVRQVSLVAQPAVERSESLDSGGPARVSDWVSRVFSHSRVLTAWRYLITLIKLQLTVTLATMPLVAAQFNVVSLISVPANLWAATWVSLLVTPAALLLAVLACLPVPLGWLELLAVPVQALAWFALGPTEWLASLPIAVLEVANGPVWLLMMSLAGVLIALTAAPVQGRWLAWILILPQIVWTPSGPVNGGWRLFAFDIGQGSAILIQTQRHNVLFDTGWRHGRSDAVKAVVLPELKALGVRVLDDVIVSHPDLDHVGGLGTLLRSRDVRNLRGSGLAPLPYDACEAGQQWEYDAVQFRMLAPMDDCSSRQLEGLERNRCSCVLLVQGRWHRALLPGDIDGTVERSLLGLGSTENDVTSRRVSGSRKRGQSSRTRHKVAAGAKGPARKPSRRRKPRKPSKQSTFTQGQRLGQNDLALDKRQDSRRPGRREQLQDDSAGENAAPGHSSAAQRSISPDWVPVDVVLMAHHGSRSSSVPAWVGALAATHAIAQAGHHNQFGHPHPTVMERWCEQGTQTWSSPRHGGIRIESGPDGLSLEFARDTRRRYWHSTRVRESDMSEQKSGFDTRVPCVPALGKSTFGHAQK